jgi:outer membrane biosynthesis protein TonB
VVANSPSASFWGKAAQAESHGGMLTDESALDFGAMLSSPAAPPPSGQTPALKSSGAGGGLSSQAPTHVPLLGLLGRRSVTPQVEETHDGSSESEGEDEDETIMITRPPLLFGARRSTPTVEVPEPEPEAAEEPLPPPPEIKKRLRSPSPVHSPSPPAPSAAPEAKRTKMSPEDETDDASDITITADIENIVVCDSCSAISWITQHIYIVD